ncbi:MAG TPA: hypothetical protein ENJ00_09700 [Phycisphaerales bacterium]|nr:hypothetical protein [Phycisphaerales bacterium]
MDQGTSMIAAIKAFAELSGNPGAVFSAANIDRPNVDKTPAPAPVPATALSTSLRNSGSMELS